MASLPSASILITPQCPHCPAVITALIALLKAGKIGKLEIINIVEHPEIARQKGVRSVPWTQIGSLELSGALSRQELEKWVAMAAGQQQSDYLGHLLETNRLQQAIDEITNNPQRLPELLLLLADLDTPMAVRIGIGALLEELEGTPLIKSASEPLLSMLTSEHQQVRADAAHYLSLTADSTVIADLEPLLDDADAEVREIAAETIAELQS
ncbi:MAG: thioredoxin family protein [Pseudomonadota bacterium]